MLFSQGGAMDGPGPCLSLILPAYNEEASLRQAIAEADEALARLCADYEILIVDDGSQDATAAIAADEAAWRPHVRLHRHAENKGYGAALRTGFEASRCQLVAFTDADCQFHLADLARGTAGLPPASAPATNTVARIGQKVRPSGLPFSTCLSEAS